MVVAMALQQHGAHGSPAAARGFFPCLRFADSWAAVSQQGSQEEENSSWEQASAALAAWVQDEGAAFPTVAAHVAWRHMLLSPGLPSNSRHHHDKLASQVLSALTTRAAAALSQQQQHDGAAHVHDSWESLKLAVFFASQLVILRPDETTAAGGGSGVGGSSGTAAPDVKMLQRLTQAGLKYLVRVVELQAAHAGMLGCMRRSERSAVDELLSSTIVQQAVAGELTCLAEATCHMALRDTGDPGQFLRMALELTQVPGGDKGSKGSCVQRLLINSLLLLLHQSRRVGCELLLLLAAHAAASIAANAHVVPPAAELFLHAAVSVAVDSSDPLLAVCVLRALSPLQASPKAPHRRQVLELASACLTGPLGVASAASGALVTGAHDSDATLRLKSLTLLDANMSSLGRLLECSPAMRRQLIAAIKARLGDSARTVRAKAIALASSFMEMPEGGSAAAHALREWLPELAETSRRLSMASAAASADDASARAMPGLVRSAACGVPPPGLHALVVDSVLGAGDSPEGDGSLALGVALLSACPVPVDTKPLLLVWSKRLGPARSSQQLQLLARLACGTDGCVVRLMRQHAYTMLCSLLHEVDAGGGAGGSSSGGGTDGVGEQSLEQMLRALQAVFCFAAPGQRGPAGSPDAEDAEGELGVVLDALQQLISMVGSDCTTHPGGALVQDCLLWGLRLLEELCRSGGTDASSPEASVGRRAAPMVFRFLAHHRRTLLLGCTHAVASASARLLCTWPASPAHLAALLHECEQALAGPEPGTAASVREAASYLLLLEHASAMYASESARFQASLAEQMACAGRGAPATGDGEEQQPQQQQQHYLQAEELARQVQAASHSFIDALIQEAGSAPANRVPLLLHVITSPSAATSAHPSDEEAGAGCQAMQVLALRALSRLMSISPRLAHVHGSLPAALLSAAAAAAAAAGSVMQLDTAALPTTQPTSPGSELLALTAVQCMELLLVTSPGTSGHLLGSLEALILAQLGGPSAARDGGAHARESRLLTAASAALSRVLLADKMQLPGSTFGVIAAMLLSRVRGVTDLATRMVHHTCGSSGGGGRHKALLSLYSNCREDTRNALVTEALLPLFLTDADLEADAFVSQVLQSLLVAHSDAARGAAACLLARATPSTRALATLLSALDARGGTSGARPVFGPQLLPHLRAFVKAYKAPATRGGAAGAAQGSATAVKKHATDGPAAKLLLLLLDGSGVRKRRASAS
ncbi:hypothetical protein FOA52_004340 [Chlamydomonas sp. UWO 241]|nr:hypothetical protein FOA52_004340 [Chlamydomonas sp. UWO 241]